MKDFADEDEIEASTEANIRTEESDKANMTLTFTLHLSSISREASAPTERDAKPASKPLLG